MEDVDYLLRPIGVVRSSLRSTRGAPNQAFEGAPEAVLEIDPAFAPALHRVIPGEDLILLTWLHRGDRSVLQTHPRDDPNTPLTGVFATRSSDRPNPDCIESQSQPSSRRRACPSLRSKRSTGRRSSTSRR
jgi:tRNA (Thr-GGU) A37 N-methylase